MFVAKSRNGAPILYKSTSRDNNQHHQPIMYLESNLTMKTS